MLLSASLVLCLAIPCLLLRLFPQTFYLSVLHLQFLGLATYFAFAFAFPFDFDFDFVFYFVAEFNFEFQFEHYCRKWWFFFVA